MKEEDIRGLNRIYCEIHGAEEFFIEAPHPDCNGKGIYADIVAKCGFIVATLSKEVPHITEGETGDYK